MIVAEIISTFCAHEFTNKLIKMKIRNNKTTYNDEENDEAEDFEEEEEEDVVEEEEESVKTHS